MAGFRLIENKTLSGKVKLGQSPFISVGVANAPKKVKQLNDSMWSGSVNQDIILLKLVTNLNEQLHIQSFKANMIGATNTANS